MTTKEIENKTQSKNSDSIRVENDENNVMQKLLGTDGLHHAWRPIHFESVASQRSPGRRKIQRDLRD
jgi:hypothetical protein